MLQPVQRGQAVRASESASVVTRPTLSKAEALIACCTGVTGHFGQVLRLPRWAIFWCAPTQSSVALPAFAWNIAHLRANAGKTLLLCAGTSSARPLELRARRNCEAALWSFWRLDPGLVQQRRHAVVALREKL